MDHFDEFTFILKHAKSALHFTVQVVTKDIKQYWTQYWPMGKIIDFLLNRLPKPVSQPIFYATYFTTLAIEVL